MRLGYLERLKLSLLETINKFPAGEVTMVRVAHDDKCSALHGNECTCNPDINFVLGSVSYEVDEEGVAKPVLSK